MTFERINKNNSHYIDIVANLYIELIDSQTKRDMYLREPICLDINKLKLDLKMYCGQDNYFLAIALENENVLGFVEAYYLSSSINCNANNHIYW